MNELGKQVLPVVITDKFAAVQHFNSPMTVNVQALRHVLSSKNPRLLKHEC
jgi:hypothetical protein